MIKNPSQLVLGSSSNIGTTTESLENPFQLVLSSSSNIGTNTESLGFMKSSLKLGNAICGRGIKQS